MFEKPQTISDKSGSPSTVFCTLSASPVHLPFVFSFVILAIKRRRVRMEKQLKQLSIRGRKYTLTLTRNPDATWECRTTPETGPEMICKDASDHEVKFLGHVAAYEHAYTRRDSECEQECEKGWEAQD
jgi:hypothetical protein